MKRRNLDNAIVLPSNKKRKLELEPALPLDAILYIADALLLDIFKTCEFQPYDDPNPAFLALLKLKSSCKLYHHALQHHLQQAKWITQGLHFLIKSQDLAGISFYCAYAAANPKEAPFFLKKSFLFYDDQFINASYLGHIKVVKLLLDNGADVHADDDYALRVASGKGHIDLVRLLLNKGANVNAQDDCALRVASVWGYTEVVRLLLERGANVNAYDDRALQRASKYGYTETIKLLLEHGADVHADNDAALRLASCNGYTEVVRLLLDYGADKNVLMAVL